MNIVYYVTNHGFGHGVRTAAISNEFSSKVRISYRTSLPEQFFREEVSRSFVYASAVFDCGCLQKDSIHSDCEATLRAYPEIARRNSKLLDHEVDWVKQQNADIVVSDITPFAFEVADRAGVPSVAVTNFTWYDIYEKYVARYPEFQAHLDKIRSQYEKASLLLALEPAMYMPYFKTRIDVPLVGRKAKSRRDEIMEHFGVDGAKKLGLIYFGHFGINGPDFKKLEQFTEWEFFGVCELTGNARNYHCIHKSDFLYQDMVDSADAMIGKAGYGAVAEAMLYGIPIMYLPRDDFAEFAVLHSAAQKWGAGYLLSYEKFIALDWKDSLDEIIRKERPKPAPVNGAKMCAEMIEKQARV